MKTWGNPNLLGLVFFYEEERHRHGVYKTSVSIPCRKVRASQHPRTKRVGMLCMKNPVYTAHAFLP